MGTINENDLRINRLVIFPNPAPGTVAISLETLLVNGTVHRTFDRDITNLLSGPTKTLGLNFLAAVEADARAALNIPVP